MSGSASFLQKYRVVSAEFWSSNIFDLENSDKIVLPNSALSQLLKEDSEPNETIKLKVINETTKKYRYCDAIDFSAPEGLAYLPSWLMKDLGLDIIQYENLNHQNITQVIKVCSLDPKEEGVNYGKAELIQLQPKDNAFVYLEESSQIVKDTLNKKYSCVKIGDIIELKLKNKTYSCTITKVFSKDKKDYLYYFLDTKILIGFLDPPKFLKNNLNEENESENFELDPDFDWEIVSIDKVKSMPEISPKPTDVVEPIDDESKSDKPEEEKPLKEEKEVENVIKVDENKKEEEIIEKDEEKENENWICSKCESNNEATYKFCPNCGNQNIKKKKPEKDDNEIKNPENGYLLKIESAISEDTKYEPLESRQNGWTLANISGKSLDIKAKLERINPNKLVIVEHENIIDIKVGPDENFFILIEVKAPKIPKEYHEFFQLVSLKDNNSKICELLELVLKVKSQYTKEQEEAIDKVCDMGFSDREKVITALQKWQWDCEKAVNWLVCH